MTAALLLLGAQVAAAVTAIAGLIARHGWRRRSSFEATVARTLPTARTLVPHRGSLGVVAARAVDLDTPAAPRRLADWEA